jgi:hypothetical protein
VHHGIGSSHSTKASSVEAHQVKAK